MKLIFRYSLDFLLCLHLLSIFFSSFIFGNRIINHRFCQWKEFLLLDTVFGSSFLTTESELDCRYIKSIRIHWLIFIITPHILLVLLFSGIYFCFSHALFWWEVSINSSLLWILGIVCMFFFGEEYTVCDTIQLSWYKTSDKNIESVYFYFWTGRRPLLVSRLVCLGMDLFLPGFLSSL